MYPTGETDYNKLHPNLEFFKLRCEICGNKQECGIEWPLNLHNYNQPLESDRANPCAHEVWVTCGDKVVCENCRQIMKSGG